MNQLAAMRDTIAWMEAGLTEMAQAGDASGDEQIHIGSLEASLQPAHLRAMLAEMERVGMSDSKMGRWLGWTQAAIVGMGLATLEDMKMINRRWASEHLGGE